MSVNIIIPQAGESVTSGVVSRWLKNDGDFVKRDEDVLELETDKVTMGIPAPAAGMLKQSAKAGDTVNIGQVVGSVDEKATAPAGASPSTVQSNGKAASTTPASTPASAAVAGAGLGTGAALGAAHGEDVRATPLARKLAQEHNIDINAISGTGAGGRVREQDVQTVIESKASTPASTSATATAIQTGSVATTTTGASGVSRRERMSPLRQRIAARLVEAQHTAAMLTTFNECDMSHVMALRTAHKEAFEKKHGVGLGFMSFFVKAVVQALKAFPAVNASIVSSKGGDLEVEYHEFYDVAVAVGTPKGLVVPVLRGCDKLSFAQIESGIKDLASRAKDGKLALADMQGGTFTITNGGIYGSLMSTPILNPPQTGILGMHSIKPRAIEYPTGSGQVAIRPMMYLALSYDHRLVDGSEAVQFLVAVKNGIESPERLLIGL